MATEVNVHGLCADCGQEVIGGTGVVVDPEGNVWHRDCRRVFLRKQRQAEEPKRGPGRPRKVEEASA
jgi:hypothetical protein